MRTLADHMAVYAAYHRHPVNRAIHFLGIPAIVWGAMVMLGLVELATFGSVTVTLAHVATLALLAWYLSMDFGLGVATVAVFTVLLVSALQVAAQDADTALRVAGAVFILGWVVQFVGHGIWEKRRPAVLDNLLQAFVAPVFLVAETAFALGFRKPLHAEVQSKMQAHLPAQAQAAPPMAAP